ncbi:pentapeptide repeat-containing protein [Psychrobacillus sp. FJAT-51614]|uniref:Pentapeptide repeat-containing protein n=1 Tax=Psychrobacillus mangrovi TaxID=3117745 RepID=A0ABU8F6J9_9BACI
MSDRITINDNIKKKLNADCGNCFGLCCVALPYAKSADFPNDKDGGTPCSNLQSDYRCGIHQNLRNEGYKGCTVYECFGAGQKVSQFTYKGKDWRDNPSLAKEMFDVFPIMQQLHEMLSYLSEALHRDESKPIYRDIQAVLEKTEEHTHLPPQSILTLDVHAHRAVVNEILLRMSELVRSKAPVKKQKKIGRGIELLGANLRGADLRGSNLRGAFLIAANLQNADLRLSDFIGADLRDADLSGADLTGSIFLTQAQINAAKGDQNTKLPSSLKTPFHWTN